MKKLICLLIVVLLFAALLVSCTDDPDDKSKAEESKSTESVGSEAGVSDESDTSSQVVEDPYVDANGKYRITNEIIDWESREFGIIVRGTGAGTYQSDDFTYNSELYGDILDKAVKERNDKIESLYNVKIKVYKSDVVGSDPIMTDINQDISTGTHFYDAIMPSIPGLANLAREDKLIDLTEFEYIHLDAPWYDKDANNTFSVGYRLFFTTGDITILNKVCSGGILFNKQMIEYLNMDSPYTLVEEHKWTYEKMYQMAKQATQDTDGEDGMSSNDTWGMLASYNDALTFYGAAGQKLCLKDGDDNPILSFGNEETSFNIAQKIITDMLEKDSWVIYAQNFEAPIWETSLEAFKQGRVLFRPSAFSATTKLRKAGTDFGIVPNPLWSEDQDDYYTYCGTGEVAGIAIHKNVNDPEFSAYMVEAISCEAKNYITPAYMEINLKGKDMQDEESLEMLKIIFNNITYDTGEIYNFGGIKTLFENLVKNNNANLQSKFDEIEPSIIDAIDKLVESYEFAG